MIVLAVIVYATLFPDPAGVDELPAIPHIDKLIHAIMFGGFAGAMAFDYTRSHSLNRPPMGKMLLFAAISLAYGGITEVLQDAMHLGRGADFYDFLADGVGVAVAVFTAPPAIAKCLKNNSKVLPRKGR